MRLTADKLGGWTLGIWWHPEPDLNRKACRPVFLPRRIRFRSYHRERVCHFGLDDLSAGKRAYCGYLQRYATFHEGDMDKFVAQEMAERQTSMECAKQMIEKARDEYTRGD